MRCTLMWNCAVFGAVAACTALIVWTPAAHAGPWRFGARGGVSYATIRGDFADVSNPGWRLGPVIGGFAEREFTPMLGLDVEASYVQKGATFEEEGRDAAGNFTPIDAELSLAYVEIPVLLRVGIPDMRPGPFVVVGTALGVALSATETTSGLPEADLSGDLKPLDFGVAAGAGVSLPTHAGRVDLEVRYTTGFFDLWDISNNVESINQGFTLTLAFSR